MATFGKTTATDTADSAPNNYLLAGRAVCPSAGTVTQMSWFGYLGANGNMKVGIYSDDAGTPDDLLAESDAAAVTTVEGWWNFPVSLAVTAATTYWLAWMSDKTMHQTIKADVAGYAYDSDSTYPTFETPFPEEGILNWLAAIYATYTPSGGSIVKKGSNLAFTMTEMLNSKMLFSICNRFPKLTTRRF